MTAEQLRQLRQDADAALQADRLDEADRLATELVAALASADDDPGLPPPLTYGLALGLLANVRLLQRAAQAAVDLFEDALGRMQGEPPGVRRAHVAMNFARLLQHLRQAKPAAGYALAAVREVDAPARALDPVSLGVLFESVDLMLECGASSEDALATLRAVLEAGQSATPPVAKAIVLAHERLRRMLFAWQRYRDALPHAKFMVGVQAARYGNDSPEAADARADYALALDQTGNYREAEGRYRSALKDLRRHRGDQHASVTRLRQNLAELARVQGDFSEAERQFRALEEEDRARHADTKDRNSQLLINYGQTLVSLARYDDAAAKLNAALGIRGARDGTDSPRYARVLLSLGQLDVQRKRYQDAVATLERAAQIYESAGETGGAESARFEASIAAIYLGEPLDAVRRTRELIAKAQSGLGGHHPEVVGMLGRMVVAEMHRLADAGWTGPLRDRVREDVEELDDVGRFVLVDMLSSLGERALQFALDQRRQWQLLHLSLVMAEPQRAQAAVDRAWRFVTRYRGAETTALRLRARRYIQYDPSGKRERIAQIKRRLVDVDLELAAKGDDPQLRSDRGRLLDELSDLEFLLAAATSQQRLHYEFIGEEAPRPRLAATAAVLTVATYLRLPDEVESYAGFLVKGDDPVRLVDLGEAASLDDAVTRFRQAITAEGRRASPNENAWREPGLELAGRVFDPIRGALSGVKELCVLADGALALVPLSALPKAGGGFVLDDMDITYDVSLPGMPGMLYEEDTGIDAPPVVLGAPSYATGQAGQREAEVETDFLNAFRGGARFEPLSHSGEECRAIATLLKVSPLVDGDATEAAVTGLRSPEVLHISTHGFYLEERDTPGSAADSLGVTGRARLAGSLDRTGLALTGANDYLDGHPAPPGAADGILYGAEIADCDFMRTDLVTLSACQTGLGDMARGDGVHGLQRAFLSAGAKTVVCSLWDVPDAPTRDMFTSFYARLMAGEPRGSAFHQTVRDLAGRYPHHPVAWGGFMLIGRTDPLARFTVRSLSVVSMKWPRADEGEESPPAIRAERLIARAQRQAQSGDIDGSLAALETGSTMEGVPGALIAQMAYTAAGIQRMAGRHEDAARAYADLERRSDLPGHLRLAVVYDAGTNFLLMSDWARAVERYTAFLDLGPSPDDTAMALVNRSAAYLQMKDEAHARADLGAVIDGPTTPPLQRAKALLNRAQLHLDNGDGVQAAADADRVLRGSSGASPDEAAGAYLIKGMVAQFIDGHAPTAVDLYKTARGVPGITPARAAQADQLLAQFEGA